MTPKEKAIDLFGKMKGFRVKHTHSKKCALICADEVLKSFPNDYYWTEVRKEIEQIKTP